MSMELVGNEDRNEDQFSLRRMELQPDVIYDVYQNGMINGTYAWLVDNGSRAVSDVRHFITDRGVIYEINQRFNDIGHFRVSRTQEITIKVKGQM